MINNYYCCNVVFPCGETTTMRCKSNGFLSSLVILTILFTVNCIYKYANRLIRKH